MIFPLLMMSRLQYMKICRKNLNVHINGKSHLTQIYLNKQSWEVLFSKKTKNSCHSQIYFNNGPVPCVNFQKYLGIHLMVKQIINVYVKKLKGLKILLFLQLQVSSKLHLRQNFMMNYVFFISNFNVEIVPKSFNKLTKTPSKIVY